MIAENAAHILGLVRGVPTLENSTSFAIGGRASDPALKEIPLPACRLIFIQDSVDEDPHTTSSSGGGAVIPKTQAMLMQISALVLVPYLDDADILGVEFPLLETVAKAVHGTKAPSGHRWRYFGTRQAFVYPDRLGFEQRYTLDWML